MAILGNAAGTTSRAYEEFFPDTRVDGVEIDSELSEIGRRYFDMNNPRLHLYHEDARPFLRRIDARYDVISVDAYRQPYIPFYLTTRRVLRDRPRPARAGRGADRERRPSRGPGRPREGAHARRSPRRFPHVMRDPIEDTNTLIVASETPLSAERLRAAVPDLPPGAQAHGARGRRAASRLRSQGGDVYTDDKAPVEWLIDKSIVDYASGE